MEASLVAIITTLGAFALGVSFTIGAIWARRRIFGKGRALAARPRSPPPPAPLLHDEEMDIPAALVGVRWKQILERFALVLGTTPVQLLRAALVAGLTGGRPITTEMLDTLDKLGRAGKRSRRGKPGSSRTH